MWHADEAILNAYLDGELASASRKQAADGMDVQELEAHLADCAECRALLTDVQQVRDRASSILASSGPGTLEMPPFEELRARRDARGRRRHAHQLHRSRMLAWAATIVLAAGIGWFARDAILTRDANQLGTPELAPPTSSEPSAERAQDALVRALDTLSPYSISDGVAQRGGVAQTGFAQPRFESSAQTIAQAPLEDRAREAAPPESTALMVRLSEDNRAEEEEQITSPLAADANVRISRQAVARPQAERARALAQEVANLEPETMDESRDDRVEIDAGRWDAVQWTSINDGEAEEMWGSGVPRLADVAVAGYAIGEWNGRAVLRVRQIVSGTAVDLMFERTDGFASRAVKAGGAATDPVARPAAPDARTLVTISEARDGYRVTVRAPLAADSLKVLLGKVREEGTP